MSEILFNNNAESTLAVAVLVGDLVLTVAAADAAKFPAPGANQFFKVTLATKNTGAKEIVHCTARAGAVLTIVRAQEGTVALAFAIGDIVASRYTKDCAERAAQPSKQNFTPVASANDLAIPAGTGFVQITGAVQVNRLVNTGWQGGQPLRLKFNGAPLVKHNQGPAGVNRAIFLKGAVDRAMAAGSTLQVVYDETDNVFYEV